ncbi:hypothetical protein DL96DRAFT_1676660 [Flagelloscypha sp. PMI_526]|nr:hypothetical protein DL96DRAFT_1676660 [Flagelloscypha sp. PMI_526]
MTEVENTLFRTSRRRFLESSQQFRDMFSLPISSNQIVEGKTDETPIVLPEKAEDFRALLKYFNPDVYGYLSTSEEWISVFRLSHKYSMEALFNEASATLAEMEISPIVRYQLAKQCDQNQRWVDMAILSLIFSPQGLEISEAEILELPLAIAICRAREHFSKKPQPVLLPDVESPYSQTVLKGVKLFLECGTMGKLPHTHGSFFIPTCDDDDRINSEGGGRKSLVYTPAKVYKQAPRGRGLTHRRGRSS